MLSIFSHCLCSAGRIHCTEHFLMHLAVLRSAMIRFWRSENSATLSILPRDLTCTAQHKRTHTKRKYRSVDLIISATMVTQLLTEELIEGFKICIFRALTAKATCRVFSRNFQQLLFIQFLLLCARWATSAAVSAVSTVICESKFLKAAAANSQGSRSMISLNLFQTKRTHISLKSLYTIFRAQQFSLSLSSWARCFGSVTIVRAWAWVVSYLQSHPSKHLFNHRVASPVILQYFVHDW